MPGEAVERQTREVPRNDKGRAGRFAGLQGDAPPAAPISFWPNGFTADGSGSPSNSVAKSATAGTLAVRKSPRLRAQQSERHRAKVGTLVDGSSIGGQVAKFDAVDVDVAPAAALTIDDFDAGGAADEFVHVPGVRLHCVGVAAGGGTNDGTVD